MRRTMLVSPTHPGEMLLEEYLKPNNISQVTFAEALGVSYQQLNELVRGKRGVTPDTALRLERVIGTSAEMWLNLQLAYDLWHAERSPAAKKIARLVPLATAAA